MLKLAIIGYGGLGNLHFNNIIEMEKTLDIKLVAICDVDENKFTKSVETNLGGAAAVADLSAYNLYTDAAELLEKEELDFVVTALPTYLHEKIAVMALESGVNVFSEKPMAINMEQGQRMLDAANKSNKLLMIGQCMRYWPEYVKLKGYIESGQFGKVIRGEFFRYSSTPRWSWENWLLNFEKSGGAALDMHVHDVDVINYAFGMPKAVTSIATHEASKFDSISTVYHYDDMFISAVVDWGYPSSYSFQFSYSVRFEKAAVELKGGRLMVYPEGGEAYQVNVSDKSAYVSEIEDFIACIKAGRKSDINQPESVLETLRLALLEIESAEKGIKLDV